MDLFLVENSFSIKNLHNFKFYNFRSGENIRFSQEAVVPKNSKQ